MSGRRLSGDLYYRDTGLPRDLVIRAAQPVGKWTVRVPTRKWRVGAPVRKWLFDPPTRKP